LICGHRCLHLLLLAQGPEGVHALLRDGRVVEQLVLDDLVGQEFKSLSLHYGIILSELMQLCQTNFSSIEDVVNCQNRGGFRQNIE
jgi:hypothetical protein